MEHYKAKLKWHKKRKKRHIYDIDAMVKSVWDDLDNMMIEAQELIDDSNRKAADRSLR
jgi:hypothetical protein